MKTLTHTAAQALIQCGRPLSDPEQASLNEHLAGCESCRTYANFHRYLSTQIPAAFPEPRLDPVKQRARVRAVQEHTRRAAMQNRTSRTLQLAGGMLLLAVLVAAVGWAIRSLAPQPAVAPLTSSTPTSGALASQTSEAAPTLPQESDLAPPVQTPATPSPTVTPAPLPGACVINAPGWTGSYTVQAGDTLVGIASTYGLTPDQLFSTNCLDADHLLAVGEVLHVPAPGESAAAPDVAATPTLTAAGQPDITGAYIWLAGFAPDGSDWLAYWLAEEIDPQATYSGPPSVLHFFQPGTGVDCPYPELITGDNTTGTWLPDGRYLVAAGGEYAFIRPCEAKTSLSAGEYAALLPPATDPGLSADGRYRASTTQVSNQDGILQLETTVSDAASGREMINVPWSRFDALGELGLGGEWISPTAFLITQTLERGPVLIEVEPTTQIVEVAPELFGAEAVVNADAGNYTGLVAYGAPHPTLAGEYHLLLSGTGMEAAFPNVRLYHSESGTVETLSYTHLGGNGFVPNSAWLLLVSTDSSSGYEQRSYFSRRVDPDGSPASLLAEDPAAMTWLQQADEVADNRVALGWNDGRVQVRAFPGGEVLLETDTSPYSAVYLNWSPDGQLLAVSGYQPGAGPAMALQVLAVP